MKNVIFLLATFAYISTCIAADPILVSGRVTDAISGEGLPFANITFDNRGTSSNHDGEFVLVIEEPDLSDIVIVKFIGYKSKVIALDGPTQDLVVKLIKSTEFLDDVQIYSADMIMQDFNNFRQMNYEFEDQLLKTYYKESVNTPTECAYLAEGIFDIYLPTIYSKKETLIESKKARKKEFMSLDSLGIPLFNGHASDMVQSATRRGDSFLGKEGMSNYIYHKEDLTNYDGKEIFIVSFEPKNKKGTSRGELYVDADSKAVIKAEYYPIIDKQNFWTNVKWVEEFVEKNGTWFIHRVSYEGSWMQDGQEYTFNSLLVVTDFEALIAPPEVVYALEDDANFYHAASAFSEDFWQGHNYIKLTEQEKISVASGY